MIVLLLIKVKNLINLLKKDQNLIVTLDHRVRINQRVILNLRVIHNQKAIQNNLKIANLREVNLNHKLKEIILKVNQNQKFKHNQEVNPILKAKFWIRMKIKMRLNNKMN